MYKAYALQVKKWELMHYYFQKNLIISKLQNFDIKKKKQIKTQNHVINTKVKNQTHLDSCF